jgi:hypothetical protein
MPEEEIQLSMDETMNAVYDDIEEKSNDDEFVTEPVESQESTDENSSPPEVEEIEEIDEDNGGDENTEIEAQGDDYEIEDQGDEEEDDYQGDILDSIDPPNRWSADDKEVFAILPREAQEVVAKREAERESYFTQQTQEMAASKRLYDSIEQIVAPRRQNWSIQGMNEVTAINQILEASDWAGRDPVGFIRWVAQNNQLDLSSLEDMERDGEYPDPGIQQANARVMDLENRLNQRDQEAQLQQKQRDAEVVDSFESETDEYGNPTHPYFSEVSDMMWSLMSSGSAPTLQDAYDSAVWSVPNVRKKIQSAERSEEKTKNTNRRKKEAAEAKKATRTNIKTNNGPHLEESGALGTMDETMAEAYDAVSDSA